MPCSDVPVLVVVGVEEDRPELAMIRPAIIDLWAFRRDEHGVAGFGDR